jgi:4-amino-4-deoxy-L-arabinose transferase-like glycosyltransferase
MRTFARNLTLIAIAALAIRVAYTLTVARDIEGVGDFFFFHWVANHIADGDGFINPFLERVRGEGRDIRPTALHPPLWPHVLSVPSLFGADSILAHKLVGCVAGSGAVAAIGILGRRVGGDAVGLVAASLAALYPVLIAADGSLMSESLYGLFVALALILALRLLSGPSLAAAALLGVVVGLATLTRTEGLGLLLVLALPAAVLAQGPLPWARRAALVAVACVAAALAIAPWTVRNIARFDQLVPVSTNADSVIGGANCDPTYHGDDVGGWQIGCLADWRGTRNEAVQAEIWRDDGIDYALDHTGRWPTVVAVRVLRTWDLHPPGKVTANEGRPMSAARLGTVAYFLLLPFAFAGAWLLRRRRELVILLGPVVLVTLSSAAGWGVSRFRHAAEIALVVLAAYALAHVGARLISRARDRSGDRALAPTAAGGPPAAH